MTTIRPRCRPYPRKINDLVLVCARGSYQEGLLSGRQNWAGSDLEGNARKYGARYHASRDSLLDRINASLPDGVEMRSAIDRSRRGQRRLQVLYAGQVFDWLTETRVTA
jgi:hypothetical protein